MIFLASKSPRRQALLNQINLDFQLIDIEIDETAFDHELVTDYVKRMARTKAEKAFAEHKDQLDSQSVILTADTTVSINSEILGKPCDYADFKRIMSLLSDNTHQVYSAIALISNNKIIESVNVSHVTFAKLTNSFIQYCWESGEPCDKAGGYAIQGVMACFIQSIEGSYSGIMGLPLYELSQALEEMSYNWRRV